MGLRELFWFKGEQGTNRQIVIIQEYLFYLE